MSDTANQHVKHEPNGRDNLLFLSFLALIFLLGGGSRADILSLAILRPVTAIMLVYAIVRYFRVRSSTESAPIWLFVCWIGLILLQMLPLPPALWTILPGREVLVQAYADASLDPGWKPLTLTPQATVNSLLALFVPLAVILLYASADYALQQRALAAIVIFALFSAAFGVLQASSGADSWLYPFEVSNRGTPIGLFANRNHQSTILALAIPLLLAFAEHHGSAVKRTANRWTARAIALGMVIVVVASGSRSGTFLAIFALVASVTLFDSSNNNARFLSAGNNRARFFRRLGLPVAFLAGIATIFIVNNGVAFERFAEKDNLEDLRFQILPQVRQMIMDGMPFGFGFGSFPDVYEIYERVELIYPSYLNHAHNDWLEILIEGGVFSLLIMAAAVGWFVRRCWRLRKLLLKPITTQDCLRSAAALGILILSVASLLDYPLRTPAGATVLALLLGALAAPNTNQRQRI